jgi:peptide/nickel transport system substrate-binding protein
LSTRQGRNLTISVAVLLIAVLTVPQGASSLAASQDPEVPETSLTIGSMWPIDSLNPLLGANANSFVFYGLVYDSLFVPDRDLEKVGHLVTDWRAVPLDDPEMIAEGLPYGSVWEYDLTRNATWHNGEPVTVEDVEWNINVRCEYYKEMWSPQPYFHTTERAEIVDDDTFRIYYFDRDTGEPAPSALGDWCWLNLLPKHMLGDMGSTYLSLQWNGVFEGSDPPVVGSGPFMATPTILEDWVAGNEITLVKNPNYFLKADRGMEVKFDKVIFKFYDDATAMRLALMQGDIDVAEFPTETFKAIDNAVESGEVTNVETYDGPKITQYWTQLAFNMVDGGPNPSRLDPVIRQALSMATNKSYIVTNFYNGFARPGTTSIPPVSKWHYEPTEEERFDFNLEAARQLLEDAGYLYPSPDADYRVCTADSRAVTEDWVDEGTELDYWMLVRREFPEERLIAAYLQDMWKLVGVKIHYEVVDESYLATVCYGFEFDTLLWYWSGCIDPQYQLFCQTKYAWGGWTDNKYYNPEYDENFNLQAHALNFTERKVYVDNCQRIHYRDVPNLIFAYLNQTYAWRTDTFIGWGDWEADPALTLDNYWTGSPLWFDLEPIGDQNSSFDAASAALVVGALVAITVAVASVIIFRKKRRGNRRSRLGE